MGVLGYPRTGTAATLSENLGDHRTQRLAPCRVCARTLRPRPRPERAQIFPLWRDGVLGPPRRGRSTGLRWLTLLSSSGTWATDEFRYLGDMIVRRRCRWRSSSAWGGLWGWRRRRARGCGRGGWGGPG